MSELENICPDCGEAEFSVAEKVDQFEYGCGADAVELSALVPVHTCESCGFQYTDEVAEDIRHETVCHHLGRMPPVRILELRKANKLTRAQFAAVTGIGSASLARWETGQLIQGPAHDSLLYLLLYKENLDRLASRAPDPEYDIKAEERPAVEMQSRFMCIQTPDSELLLRQSQFSLH